MVTALQVYAIGLSVLLQKRDAMRASEETTEPSESAEGVE